MEKRYILIQRDIESDEERNTRAEVLALFGKSVVGELVSSGLVSAEAVEKIARNTYSRLSTDGNVQFFANRHNLELGRVYGAIGFAREDFLKPLFRQRPSALAYFGASLRRLING